MDQERRSPTQDIAGVSGGGLEEDRDQTPSVEPITREQADDHGAPKRRSSKLNDKPVAPEFESTKRS
jgi:hypothetical protein